MEKSDEKRVTDFLNSHRKEIEDNDFTNRVMQQLPEKKSYWYITPLFTLLGVLVVSLLTDFRLLLNDLYSWIENTPLIYLIGIYYLVFAVILIWFYHKGKEYLYS